MSFDPFPERIEPRKLFTRNGSVKGLIKLEKLARLRAYLSSDIGQVEAELEFSHDDNNRRLITGKVNAELPMLCQRCLKETSVVLTLAVNVLILSDKQWSRELADSLPEGLEALQVSEDELDVQALIEDEVILSLPIVANHENESCNEELNKLHNKEVELKKTEAEELSNKPFASLQSLKQALNNDD